MIVIVDTNEPVTRTNLLVNAQGDIVAATVRLKSLLELSTRRTLTRELFHELGFGKTCAWSSVTAPTTCTGPERTTADDAAMLALAYHIRAAHLTGRPTTTIGDALRGQRRLELGLVNP
jgi:hypothetical protein